MTNSNQNLVLICGKSATGKSASLKDIPNPEGVLYMNTENNKKLPFKSKFCNKTIADPIEIKTYIAAAESEKKFHSIAIDSLTYMMDMFESKYIIGAADSRAAWGEYSQFFRTLMSDFVAHSTKNIIFTAHTMDIFNEKELAVETMVKVKGALMNTGIESFFSAIVACKKVSLTALEQYKSPYLTITEEDELVGYKHCFQTRLTKETIQERIRAPMGMWSVNETYIDNNAAFLLERLEQYYS